MDGTGMRTALRTLAWGAVSLVVQWPAARLAGLDGWPVVPLDAALAAEGLNDRGGIRSESITRESSSIRASWPAVKKGRDDPN